MQRMLQSEYAFAARARSSVRTAFLEYLADDSWLLSPDPQPGRPRYQAAKDRQDKLEWYPTLADVAPSGDLGFTSGPWVLTLATTGAQLHGHFLTIWRRDAQCRWRVQIDGGISHPRPERIEPKLAATLAPVAPAELPPAEFIAEDALGHAVSDFQATAQQDGIAAALRTYGRGDDFIWLTDERAPAGIWAAVARFDAHDIVGAWKEDARGRSADSTLMYSLGELTDGNGRGTHVFLEIWQYDPRVANWGLRILLINPLPQSKGP